MSANHSPYAAWFRASMWLGIIANLVLSVPGMFVPNTVLGLAKLPQVPETPVWPAFASNLLMLLSVMYIPGAIDPYRYRATAILSVFVARVAGVVFFFVIWPNRYPAFGLMDLTFFLIQAPLLILTLRHAPPAETRGP